MEAEGGSPNCQAPVSEGHLLQPANKCRNPAGQDMKVNRVRSESRYLADLPWHGSDSFRTMVDVSTPSSKANTDSPTSAQVRVAIATLRLKMKVEFSEFDLSTLAALL